MNQKSALECEISRTVLGGDYVPIGTLRVPPALVECQLACPILTQLFAIFDAFLGFLKNFLSVLEYETLS